MIWSIDGDAQAGRLACGRGVARLYAKFTTEVWTITGLKTLEDAVLFEEVVDLVARGLGHDACAERDEAAYLIRAKHSAPFQRVLSPFRAFHGSKLLRAAVVVPHHPRGTNASPGRPSASAA